MHNYEFDQKRFKTIAEFDIYISGIIDDRQRQLNEAIRDGEIDGNNINDIRELLSMMRDTVKLAVKLWSHEQLRAIAWINLQFVSMYMQDPSLGRKISNTVANSLNAAFSTPITVESNGKIH